MYTGRLLTELVTRWTPSGAAHHPLGTGWVQGCSQAPQGSSPSPDLIGGKVTGQSSLAVSSVIAGTAAVEAGKEQLVWGVHKPPGGVSKKTAPR